MPVSRRSLQRTPELREYVPADFERLWQLDQRCFARDIAYSRDELAYYLRDKTAICLLATDADALLGFILGHRERRGFGHIVTLDVDEKARRSRVGSLLMQTLERRFRESGCTSMFLEVAVNNHSALAFYKKHGYNVLKTLRRYYPGDLDGLLLGKPISEKKPPRTPAV
jgi:ribosomal protein S18 acetylase RimI-like enzyme